MKKINPFYFFLIILVAIFFVVHSNKIKNETKENINIKRQKIRENQDFYNFKKDKLLISKSKYSDIRNQNLIGRIFIPGPDFADSIIIVRTSGNIRYIHFIEAGAKFKMLDIAGAKERTATGRIDLDIHHEDFLKNNKYQYHSKIRVRDKGYVAHWEVNPQDIKYEPEKLGIIIMENKLIDYTNNNTREIFIDSTSFVNFFPDSDLIDLFKRKQVLKETVVNKTNYKAIEQIEKSKRSNGYLNEKKEEKETQRLERLEAEIDAIIISTPAKTEYQPHEIDIIKEKLSNPELEKKEKRKLKKRLRKLERQEKKQEKHMNNLKKQKKQRKSLKSLIGN